MNKNILMVIPPVKKKIIRDYAGDLGFERDSKYFLPNLDLIEMASILNLKSGFKSKVLDFEVLGYDSHKAYNIIYSMNPDIIIIKCSLPTIFDDIEFIRKLSESEAKIFIRINTFNKEILNMITSLLTDVGCIIGEVYDNLDLIICGKSKEGLAYKINKTLFINKKELINDFDKYYHVDRKLLNNTCYSFPKLGTSTTMITSKGCPFKCNYYCPYPLTQGKIVRYRSLKNVINEIKEIEKLGIKNIFLRDPIFTFNKSRTIELLKQIRKEKISIKFWCETRIDLLDEELIQEMSLSNFIGINVGVETSSEKIRLNLLKNNVTNQLIKEKSDILKKYNIKLSLLFMIGFPGEEKIDILNIAQLLLEIKPESIGISFPVSYPGTQFYKDHKPENFNYSDLDGSLPQIINEKMSSQKIFEAKKILDKYNENIDINEILINLKMWSDNND